MNASVKGDGEMQSWIGKNEAPRLKKTGSKGVSKLNFLEKE